MPAYQKKYKSIYIWDYFIQMLQKCNSGFKSLTIFKGIKTANLANDR